MKLFDFATLRANFLSRQAILFSEAVQLLSASLVW